MLRVFFGYNKLMPKPWNKIKIPKEKIKYLYEDQGLSIAQIASKLGYSNEPIHRLLREYHLKIRTISEAKEKFKISKKELRNLYYHQKLSMNEIAKKYDCNHVTIVNRIRKYNLKSRGHLGLTKPIRISKEKFEYLYHIRRLSLDKIAKILHCSEGGLQRKIKKFVIKTRPISERACKYKKKDFDGTLEEKAYMIGFRLGDLNIKPTKNLFQARCSTTKRAQIMLIKNLFSPYTTPHVWKAKRGTLEIVVLLNKSFNFLLPKNDCIEPWILRRNKYFWAFFAGYADAEGCLYININKNRGIEFTVFSLSSYDKQILFQIWNNLKKLYILSSPPFLKAPKGTPCSSNKKYFSNGDAWCLTIAKKDSLWKLIHFWEKYSRHSERKKAIDRSKNNLILRNQLPYCHKIDLSIPVLF